MTAPKLHRIAHSPDDLSGVRFVATDRPDTDSDGASRARLEHHSEAEAAPLYVVVSGPTGSGKSTLALALAREHGLAVISKDTIKEALMEALPTPDVEVDLVNLETAERCRSTHTEYPL